MMIFLQKDSALSSSECTEETQIHLQSFQFQGTWTDYRCIGLFILILVLTFSELLKKYVPDDANCAEVFARGLTPGWTSFGNQTLLFQSLEGGLFQKIPATK
jgi:hypothetical protein